MTVRAAAEAVVTRAAAIGIRGRPLTTDEQERFVGCWL